MTEFQNALARFLKGQLDLPGLEAALRGVLQKEPNTAGQILQTLDQLFRASRLSAKDYIALKQTLEAPQSLPTEPPARAPSPEPPVMPLPPEPIPEPPPEPPPEPAPTSETPLEISADSDSSSDILDILGSGGSEPKPAVTPAPVPPVTDVEQPSDDKTVFRQSAPASPQQGQSATPYTGTGSFQQTGQTGGISRPTGSASIPTGTGSNWTDPSKWGGGPAPTMQPGSILKDRYVLETIIGRGGMGVVFKAKDLRREEAQDRNPYIAVKILNDEFRRHPESLKALQRESRKAQDLAHPNIVTVFDFDRDGATVFMTMEFLEGQSLDRVTKDPTFDGMPLKEAFPFINGLGRALAYAHRKGVVHSDFKPGNAFLTKEGVIKVFDFGIARASKLPGQQSGEMTLFDPGTLGALTPAYASCEMIEGEEPDARDDIYALACLAYELLAGRHPFDKRPATDARDKGLKAKPIKGLSRRNWRGLQKGLAFKREDRSSNVEEFLDDLKVRKLNKTAVGLGSAAGLAAIFVLAVQGPAYLEERKIMNMITSIVSGNDGQIPLVLAELGEFDAAFQDEVISDGQVKDRLIDYYYGQIVRAEEALDYPRAEAVLAEAESLYDDSLALGEARDTLEENKANLLAELNSRYNDNLQAGRLMPSDGEDIVKVLAAYERIDPNHPALTDPQLAIAYADMAEELLANDVLQAERVINEGRGRFPDDARLIGLRDRVNTLREVQNREVRVAELEEEISGALTELAELQDFLSLERAVFDLDTLDPTNTVLARFHTRVDDLAGAIIEEALADNDWLSARLTVDEYSNLLSRDFTEAARRRIDAAASEYDNRVGSVYASLVDAAENGDRGAAANYLNQLEQLNAAPGTIAQARDIVTRAYVSAAQAERVASRFEEARALIEAGRAVDPSFAGWQDELDVIAGAEQLEGQTLAEQERTRLRQQTQDRINSLKELIQANLNKSPFGIDTARATLQSIDELTRLDPADSMARNGRKEVAAKLATQARGMGARDQNFDGALALIDGSIELLPTEQSLRQAQADLQSQMSEYRERVAAEQASQLRDELELLLASPAYDGGWEADLRRVVQGLEPLASDAAYLSGKRQEVAGLYVSRARELRSDKRFDLAGQMLTASEWFVGDYAAAAQERQTLEQARQAFNAANREREQRAQVDGLKRTFATELNAENFQQARAALATLSNLLGRGDPFVANEAPQAIADAYLKIAERRLVAGEFDNADRFAREGLKAVANHPGLTTLLAEIRPQRLQRNQAELEAAIKDAVPTDAARPRNLLNQIRADAGADFTSIEADLRKLADARVAASKSERDAVVAWLSGIFSNYVAPSLEGTPCTPNLAGYGSRSRGQCYDYLPGSSEEGPRLVVIPTGNGVARPIAIARQEISVGQWNAYCQLSGNCSLRNGQSERLPITNITIGDAEAYASWLSAGTKHRYRLPTSLEWEHAARADGTKTISPNCINRQAGLLGDVLLEVDRGGDNAWGVQNYIGNAQEWVVGSSGALEVRGGAYTDRLGVCDISLSRQHAGAADEMTGFRLVRELAEDS